MRPPRTPFFPCLFQRRQNVRSGQIVKVEIRGEIGNGLRCCVRLQAERQVAARECGKHFRQCVRSGQAAFAMQTGAQHRAIAGFDYR